MVVSAAVNASRAHDASATTTIPSVGVHAHLMWDDYTDEQRIAVLDKMAAAGVKWVRIDFGWSSLQPTGPGSIAQWYVDRADMVVDAARARGINVLMTFWRTPDWANGGRGPYVPPTDPADFGRAAHWVANHFKGRVAAWEVWNEPNLANNRFWTGTPADYAGLLKASYAQFKAGDPAAPVLAGSVVYNDDAWLRKMYESGAKGYFDAISTHPYQAVADEPPEAPDNGTIWRMSHVPAVHQLMVEYGDGSKPIWFTEFGWSNHDNYEGLGSWELGVTDEQQGDYFVRAVKYVAENHPYVENMFWYNERNRDTGNIQLDNYGLLYRDLTPKLAYNVVKSYLTSLATTPSPTPSPSDSPTPSPSPTPTPTPSPTPTESPSPTPSPVTRNFLANGGFESGLEGWTAEDASLELTSLSHRGEWAGRVAAWRRPAHLVTATELIPDSVGTLRVTGHVKARRAGRVVRVVVREVIHGRVTFQRSVRFRTKGSWQAMPAIEFRSSGLSGACVRVRIHLGQRSPKRLLADSFRVGSPLR